MDTTQIFGYLGALAIGLVLGLMGGGGSILTVPILVYVLKVEPVLATTYSLFVVGSTSLVGAINNALKGRVDYKTGILFAVPASLSAFLTKKYVIAWIPDTLFQIGGQTISKDMAIMVFFAIIMLIASYSMIKGRKGGEENENVEVEYNYPMIAFVGLFLGLVTGLVGAGGGFLIIPALIFLAKLPMKRAVATSLMVIVLNSLIGFIGGLDNAKSFDWPFIIVFTSLSIVGIFVGIYLNKLIHGAKLKKAFGWFVLIMGIYIVLKEVL